MGSEKAREEGRWIDVNEKLPEANYGGYSETVLVAALPPEHHHWPGLRFKERGVFADRIAPVGITEQSPWEKSYRVTHWRPMPSGPLTGEEVHIAVVAAHRADERRKVYQAARARADEWHRWWPVDKTHMPEHCPACVALTDLRRICGRSANDE